MFSNLLYFYPVPFVVIELNIECYFTEEISFAVENRESVSESA